MILSILRSRSYSLLAFFLLLLAGSCPSFSSTIYTVSLADSAHHLVEVQIQLPAGQAVRRITASGVERPLSGPRFFPIRELGSRPRSRWPLPSGSQTEQKSLADFRGRKRSHGRLSDVCRFCRTVRRPTERAPCVLQSCSASDVFRKRPARIDDGTLRESSERLANRYALAVLAGWNIHGRELRPHWSTHRSRSETFRESDFDEGGRHYRVVIDAEPADYDMEKIDVMLHKVVAAATSWMDDRPFQTYMFIYHFPRGPAGGGMEHAYSTAIDVNAEAMARSPEILSSV